MIYIQFKMPRLPANRKSERTAVNEMKRALFARTDNDHIAHDALAETFATAPSRKA